MNTPARGQVGRSSDPKLTIASKEGFYYGGGWHLPVSGRFEPTYNPATGEIIADAPYADVVDVEAAIAAAVEGFKTWRKVVPLERARIMREVAAVIRANADELAYLDSANGGNPIKDLGYDTMHSALHWEFFAGLVTEIKGDSIPMGPDVVNFTMREPYGVVARLGAYNHPFMFTAQKAAAPIAAGNAVICKPPEQAPLSSLRFAELVGHLLPAGVLNIIAGGKEAGATLASHPRVEMVTLIGAVPTGRAIMKGASDRLKPLILELGGKNALVAFGDADPDRVAAAVVAGMNFGWCGQSCGSTSRAFLHADIHDAVLERVKTIVKNFKPGIPTDPATTMGTLISKPQLEKVMYYIDVARNEDKARLVAGGSRPDDPKLANGFFVEPTIFADVTQDMRIANEEVFGPVLSVLKWTDREAMIEQVNRVEYGLTCSIWTNDISQAHRTASEAQAGMVWINEIGRHFTGAPFGGYKQSGMNREEGIGELLAFTQEKNIHVRILPPR